MKKAQISQVFTYLVIILVIGVIAVFGYKGINMILNTQCEHQRTLFEKNLLGFIDEYSDYGSVHEETLKAPCDVNQVCFIDSEYYESLPPPTISELDNDAVFESALIDKKDNVFVRTKFSEPIGFSNKVALKPIPPSTIPPSFQCFTAKSGEFKFLFTGLGRKTQIEAG